MSQQKRNTRLLFPSETSGTKHSGKEVKKRWKRRWKGEKVGCKPFFLVPILVFLLFQLAYQTQICISRNKEFTGLVLCFLIRQWSLLLCCFWGRRIFQFFFLKKIFKFFQKNKGFSKSFFFFGHLQKKNPTYMILWIQEEGKKKTICFSGMPYSTENLRCCCKWKSDFVTNESLLAHENYHSV